VRSVVVVVGLSVAALVAAVPSGSGVQPSGGVQPGPVLGAAIHEPPTPVPGTDKRRHLVYEILLENRASRPIRFGRLQVRDPVRRRMLAAYRGREIRALMVGPDGQAARRLASGKRGAMFLDLSLRRGRRAPGRLAHRFVLSLGAGDRASQHVVARAAFTRVVRKRRLRIGPPLRGEDLAVFGCCGAMLGHRRALMEVDGRLSLSQRYAIDFVRVDERLRTFAGARSRNESYFIFGAEVLAVAPGRVVATRSDLPEETPPNEPPPDPDTATGNYVVQDLGGGRFALYAHLQPAGVLVNPGDRVRRGQVLGLVGNTGLPSEPHLHFHVVDGPGVPARLGGDGVAYVFDRFTLDAHISGLEEDPPAPSVEPAAPPRERRHQYPFTGDIVGFP
jgi:Peptidase family M23